MKAVIDGKLYNTETAEEVAYDSWGYAGDFSAWAETLYQTKKGQFFIHGEGGPRSRYAEATGQGEMSGSARIRLLTEEEALGWCEGHFINGEVVAKHFDIEEG